MARHPHTDIIVSSCHCLTLDYSWFSENQHIC
jgi:hypothetical protein